MAERPKTVDVMQKGFVTGGDIGWVSGSVCG